jgi:hypothetical protein
MIKKNNAAIYLISSRTKLLELSLSKLFRNWNYKYNYPVYVHYFNNIYDENFIKRINKISKNIFFHQIDYSLPKNLNEKELFYNRKEVPYVKTSFPKKRLGFLHTLRFMTNITSFGKLGCPVKELENYDYLMRIDDDSNFKKEINFDFFDVLKKYPIATGYMYNNFTHRMRDTRLGLWDFYKKYLKKYGYSPKNQQLKNAVESDDEKLMHTLYWTCGNCNLYNIKAFLNSPWREFLNELNNFNGDYKFRWGDLEVITLFAYTHFDEDPYNFNLKEKGLYEDKFPTFLSSIAPGIDNSLNVHNFLPLRIYHFIMRLIRKFMNKIK